jgi:hypothetical protein
MVLALALSLGGCGDHKRPPLINSSPHAGLKPTLGDGSAGAGDGSAGAGPDSTLPGGDGAIGGGDLGSSEVSLFGTLGGAYFALAPVSTPNTYVVGFNQGWSSFKRQGSSLLYLNDNNALYRFVEDGKFSQRLQDISYPEDPGGNDALVDTPKCGDVPLVNYFISSSGHLVYSCLVGKTTTYYDGNDVIFDGKARLLALGTNDLGLGRVDDSLVTVSLAAPDELHPVMDIPPTILAYRAHDDGFYVVTEAATTDLWQVSADGTAENLGSYPAPPEHTLPVVAFVELAGFQIYTEKAALTKDAALYQIGDRVEYTGGEPVASYGVILRRSIDGPRSELVYDEVNDPHVVLGDIGINGHIATLITSP